MLPIQLVEQLPFGMLKFCGQVVVTFCSASRDMLKTSKRNDTGGPFVNDVLLCCYSATVRALKRNGCWFQNWYADDTFVLAP